MISVVMPVRNSEHTIAVSLTALLESPLVTEVLIADGKSDDGTPEIIRGFSDERVRLVSKSDSGIYNGVNKALAQSAGEFIIFMNSNDYLNPVYLEKAICAASSSQADFVYGCISMSGRRVRPRLCRNQSAKPPWQVMPFPHVSMIVRRSVHQRLVMYDEGFKIASDLDYINRLLIGGAKGVFVDEIAAYCAPGGVSSGFQHIFEARRVAIKNGRSPIFSAIFAIAIAIYRVVRR